MKLSQKEKNLILENRHKEQFKNPFFNTDEECRRIEEELRNDKSRPLYTPDRPHNVEFNPYLDEMSTHKSFTDMMNKGLSEALDEEREAHRDTTQELRNLNYTTTINKLGDEMKNFDERLEALENVKETPQYIDDINNVIHILDGTFVDTKDNLKSYIVRLENIIKALDLKNETL